MFPGRTALVPLAMVAWLAWPPVRAQEDSRFIVAVVGANTGRRTTEACADVPGYVLEHGARWAFGKAGLPIRLEVYDDGGCRDDARNIAASLARDPRVLAVIGHATSATTQIGAEQYMRAGIPLLAPMATSPNILHPENSAKPFHNVFRLPPGDEDVQGPALAFLATELPKTRSYVAVQDISPTAFAYSDPLVNAVVDGFRKRRVEIRPPLKCDAESAPRLAATIHELGPGVVVYCGYPGVFRRLLPALAAQYKDSPASDRPVLLLSDGAKGASLNVGPFEAYLTYPIPDIAGTRYPEEIRNDIGRGNDEYEIYAYDAMTLLVQAYGECKDEGEVSRACILRRLGTDHSLVGGASIYSFAEGKNQLAPYQVYRVDRNVPKPFCAIEPFTIPKVRAGAPPPDSECAAALRRMYSQDSK